MFYLVKLEKNIKLEPKDFGPEWEKRLTSKLTEEVEGTCSIRHGYIIKVQLIEVAAARRGMLQEGTGMAVFTVPYDAIVFKPFKNEVVEGIVTNVTKIGFYANVGPLEVFVSKQLIPGDYTFDPVGQCFKNDDHSLKIATKNAVLLKIQGLSMSEGNLYAIGTIKEDYLGPTEN